MHLSSNWTQINWNIEFGRTKWGPVATAIEPKGEKH